MDRSQKTHFQTMAFHLARSAAADTRAGVTAEAREIAIRRGAKVERTAVDHWAAEISRLSDAEFEPNEFTDVMITLMRKKILATDAANELLRRYFAAKS